jgi:hypothetical protein
MSPQKPTYFIAPARPYPPYGPIRLGTIITSPTQPDEPLHQPSLPSPTDISSFQEQHWTGSHISKTSSRFGVWTCFLEMILGAGIDITLTRDKETRQKWAAQSMTTISFHPSEAFLADAIAHEDVKNYITAHLFREKVYMITGVMIASSTTVLRECIEAKGLFIHAGIDATSWAGVPISVGPEGKWKHQTNIVRLVYDRKNLCLHTDSARSK